MQTNLLRLTALALTGGQIPPVVGFYGEVEAFIKQGRLIPLGVFGPARLPALPQVPTMTEQSIKDLELLSDTVYTVAAHSSGRSFS